MTDKISRTLYLSIYLSKMLDTMLIRSLSRDKIKLVLSLTRKYRRPFPKRLKWRHHHYPCEIGVILKKLQTAIHSRQNSAFLAPTIEAIDFFQKQSGVIKYPI